MSDIDVLIVPSANQLAGRLLLAVSGLATPASCLAGTIGTPVNYDLVLKIAPSIEGALT